MPRLPQQGNAQAGDRVQKPSTVPPDTAPIDITSEQHIPEAPCPPKNCLFYDSYMGAGLVRCEWVAIRAGSKPYGRVTRTVMKQRPGRV